MWHALVRGERQPERTACSRRRRARSRPIGLVLRSIAKSLFPEIVIERVEFIVIHATFRHLPAKWGEQFVNARGGDGLMEETRGIRGDILAMRLGALAKL